MNNRIEEPLQKILNSGSAWKVDFKTWMDRASAEVDIWMEAFQSIAANRLPVCILDEQQLLKSLSSLRKDAKSLGFVLVPRSVAHLYQLEATAGLKKDMIEISTKVPLARYN